jgi:hypothetical protein
MSLGAIYVDARDERRIVAIKPKPAFRPVFQVATTREGSEVVLIKENGLQAGCPEAAVADQDCDSATECSWWRRGRVDLGREHGVGVLLAA